MTKEVQVTIQGSQGEAGEEPIVVTATGSYHFTNGRHFIQYEEQLPDRQEVSRNMIKLSTGHITLTKKNSQNIQISQMEFDLKEITKTIYPTSYGNLYFDIHTKKILMKEEPDRIEFRMAYALLNGDALISENQLDILIEAVKAGRLL